VKAGPAEDSARTEIYGRFLALLEKHAGEMSEFLVEVENLVPGPHFSHLKFMVAKVLGHGHMPVQEEVCQKYPVLKRDWMR
jgi:hypothetical protein